ncbi:unnamed protein product [Psylliodes chrysocephalus]|uniref:Uncharacterized protein n=1 Tax=Psylliodes chrysocephalus TaxID=3402493 RepID=A0A9P0D4T1_9CUCU|nr:unnamed protein product [Psylliodes chrysocephala]
MEENSKHTSDKKVFIITPEELAKLGILDSLTAEIKNKNAEKKIETPTASTSTIKPTHFFKNTTEKILLDLFKQNKVCNKLEDDKVVFKKPRQASNFNEIKDNATITKFPQTMDGEKKIIDNDLSMASSSKSQCAFNISMKNVHNTSNKRKLQSKKVTNKQESMSGHADSNKTTEESSVSERKNIVNLISTSLKDKLKKNISNRGKVSASEIKFNGDFSSKIHSKNRKSVPSFKKSAHVGIHNNMNTTTNPSSSQDLIKSVTNMLQSSINNVDKNIPKINEQFKNKEVTNTIISSDKEATECVREKTKNKIVILENIKILGVHSSGTSELHNKSSLVSRPKTDHNTNLQNQTQTVNQNILQDPLKTEFAVSQISEKPEIITSKISLTQDDNNVNVPCMTESLMKNTAEEKLLLDSARVKSLDVSNNFENIKVSSKRTEDSNNLEPGVLRITTNKRYLTAGTVETVLTDNKLHAPITIVGLPIIKTPLKEMHSKEINSETEELVIKKTSSTYDVDKEKPCDMYVQPSGFLLPKKRGRPRLPSESSGNNDIVVKNVDSVEKTHDLNKSTTEIKIKDMKEIEILKNIKLNKIDSNLVMNTLADTLVKQKSLLYDENLKTFSNLNPGTLLPKKRSRKSSATVINENTNRICEKTNVNDSEKTVDPEIRNHEEFGPIKDNVTKSEREDNVLKDTSSGVERSSFEKIPIIEKKSSSFEVNTNFNLEENLLKKSDKPNINQSGMVQTIATPKKPSVDAVYIPNETDIKLSGSIAETSKHVGQLLHLKNIEKQNIDEDQTISKSVQDDDCFKVVATDQSQLKNNKKDDHKGGSELDQEKTDEQSLLKHNAGESTLTFSNNALVTNTRNLPYIIQDGHEGRKSICDDYKDIEKEKYIPIKKSKRYRIPCRTNTQTHKMVEVNSTEQIPQPQSILSTDLPIKKKLKRPQKKLNLQNNVKNDIITKPDSTIENLDVSTLNLENQSDVYNAGDTSKFEEKNISINTSISNSEPHTNLKRGIKPKSEYVAPPEENIELPMEKSIRGRRHVKINYLELENMFVEDTYLIKQIKKSDEDKAPANTSFNSSDMPKKKRGRPRKSELTLPEEKLEVSEGESVVSKSHDDCGTGSKVEEKNDVPVNKESKNNSKSTDIQHIEDANKTSNEANIIKTSSDEPNKNKRGRPRKALQPGAEITLPMDKPETSSTCNQSDQNEDSYHIENEVNIKTLDDEVNSIPSTSFDSPASTVKKRGRPRKDHFKDIELMEIESKRGSRQSVTYSETKNQLDEDSVEEIGFIKKRKRKISSSDQEIIDEPVEKPKYVYTGRYTKLINDVFTAAVSKSDDTEENPNANINFQPRVCGRPKKNTEPAISVDDNGQVTCVPCQIKIPEEEWIDHNENKHSNLSWREGEHVVLLDQPSLLKDKLKPLLKKNGSLTCTKCKQKFMKILPFVSHTEECIGIVVNGNVTCSSCNKSMPKKDWSHHKIRHNNMTWRVGEHPLDLNNETFVLTTLNALYKAKKPLYCEKCGIVKKSVVGLLSHLGQCGNTEQAKIECELCGKKVLPVSLPTHIKLAHETAKKVETTSNYFQVDLEVSQKRRKAATKAMAKIDEFSSDTKETLTHFIINMKFEDNDLLMAFINKELEENNFVKCKISTCEFSSVKILDALSHLKDCSLKLDQRFTCKTCFLTEPTEEDIIDHLQKVHNLEMKQEDPEYVYNDEDNNVHDFFLDDENALERPKKRKRYLRTQPYKDTSNLKLKPRFIHLVSRGKYADSNLFSHAFEYAFEFCEKNYNIKSLFDDLKCDECFWNLIDDEHLEKYMPLYELSCDVVIRKVKGLKSKSIFKDEIGFKKYELFEVEQQDARTTIFCGAPVRCMAWMPTPYESLNQPQILAVATSKHFDEKYNHLKHYSETTVIQFWNFGLLQNGKDITEPKLEFCLGVDNGPVWCMEWCPSGCYNVDGSIVWSRRGLLAVAGHSMPVHIYSIPLLTEDQSGLFYKAKPVLKLQLVKDDTNLKRLLFPTKLSWSKVSGHNHIAVGYSDGTVALYNLNTSSKLLRFIDKSSADVLMPYKILKTHSHYISAISFIPIGQGNRWLLTSSFDKAVHLWDLYTDDKISLKKGKLASDVVWLTQWLSFITGGDESTAVGQAVAVTNSHREYLYDVHTLSYSLSSFTSISTSDWLNAFVHGNENGEIVISLLHQMLYEMGRLRKSNDYRYILGYSKLIDKTLSPEERATVEEEKKKVLKVLPRQRRKLQEASDGNSHYHWYEPYEYEEATAKYGLMFCDTADLYKLSSTYQDTEPVKSNLYPLMAINQVSFNPNQQASLFFATGYQIGFVRVSYLKFLEDDRQIRKSKS